MEPVAVNKFYKGGGFRKAIAIGNATRQNPEEIEKIITLGRKTGATIDEGAGEIILIEMPNKSQYILPIEGLSSTLANIDES
jgi:hypothetical protein